MLGIPRASAPAAGPTSTFAIASTALTVGNWSEIEECVCVPLTITRKPLNPREMTRIASQSSCTPAGSPRRMASASMRARPHQIGRAEVAAVLLVGGEDQAERPGGPVRDPRERRPGQDHRRAGALHVGRAEPEEAVAFDRRGEGIGSPLGGRVADRLGVEMAAERQVRPGPSAVDADDQVRPVRLSGQDSWPGQPVVRERSLDHRRGRRLVPRQIRGRRRDQRRGQRDDFALALAKKPLRRVPASWTNRSLSSLLITPSSAVTGEQTPLAYSDDEELASRSRRLSVPSGSDTGGRDAALVRKQRGRLAGLTDQSASSAASDRRRVTLADAARSRQPPGSGGRPSASGHPAGGTRYCVWVPT